MDVGRGLEAAALATDPLGLLGGVVVAIAVELVAVGAERDAVRVIAAVQTGGGVRIRGMMAEVNGAQGVQVVKDVAQDVVAALTGVAQDFANLKLGVACPEVLEAGEGLEVVIAVGRDEGATEGPEGKEAVVHDIEGLALVTEVVFAAGRRVPVPRVRRGLGLIAAAVIDISGVRVTGRDLPTVRLTGGRGAVTAAVAVRLGGTRAGGGLEAGRVLVMP